MRPEPPAHRSGRVRSGRDAGIGGASRTAASTAKSRFQLRRLGADALFDSQDGCIVTDAFVGGADEAVKTGPGKPTTGPFAFIGIGVFDLCTDRLLRGISGETNQAVFTAERVKLGAARLQATIPAFDFVNEVAVEVVLDLAWTSFGEPFVQSSHTRIRQGGLRIQEQFKGTFRDECDGHDRGRRHDAVLRPVGVRIGLPGARRRGDARAYPVLCSRGSGTFGQEEPQRTQRTQRPQRRTTEGEQHTPMVPLCALFALCGSSSPNGSGTPLTS